MKNRICEKCGAIGESCCTSSKERQKIANELSKIVQRQSVKITELTRELQEARQVAADLRAKAVA